MLNDRIQPIQPISEKGNIFFSFVPQICAIMVVILHQYNVDRMAPHSFSNHFVGFVSHGICTAAVPTFYCISGFLFWRNVTTFGSIKEKLFRRIKTILVPFLLWNGIYALITNVLKHQYEIPPLSEIVSSLFLYKYYFPMWFMFQLIVFFSLSPFIYLFMKHKIYMIILIIVLAILSILVTNNISFEYNCLSRSLIQFNYLIYFLCGALVSKLNYSLNDIPLPHISVCVLIFLVASFVSSLLMDNYIQTFYKRLFVPIVLLSFMALMISLIQILHNKIELLYGVSPMAIYGIHGLAGMMVVAFLNYVGWQNSVPRYLFLCSSCLVLSIMICSVIKKILPKMYSLFVGNR